jgi:hypothetical protein
MEEDETGRSCSTHTRNILKTLIKETASEDYDLIKVRSSRTLSELKPYSIDDSMIDICGAVDGRIFEKGGNRSSRWTLALAQR